MLKIIFDYGNYVSSFFAHSTLVNVFHFQLLSGEIFLLVAIIYLLVWVAIKSPRIKVSDLSRYVSFVIFVSLLFNLITPVTLTHSQIIFNSLLVVDNFTSGGKLIFLGFLGYISMNSFKLFSQPEILNSRPGKYIEYQVAVLFISLFGCLFISSFDFVVLYMVLEGLSLVIFVLLIFNPNSHANTEAGVKYFCLSVFISCFLGFGISIIYGLFQTTNFLEVREEIFLNFPSLFSHQKLLLTLAILFIFGAFLFKLGASPFQFWVAEVYAGTETLVTSLLIIPVKFAFFLAFSRLAGYVFYPCIGQWQFFILIFAISSIIIGSFGAIWQDNIKKFIAFTSVNQIGFLLLSCATGSAAGFAAALFNLFFYSVANLAFFVVLLNTNEKNSFKKIETLNELSRFATLYPTEAYFLAVVILSMAGIPPLAGFFGKFFILIAAVKAGFIVTTSVALVVTVVSAFYYIRLVKNIFFDAQDKQQTTELLFTTSSKIELNEAPELGIPRLTLQICSLILIFAVLNLPGALDIFTNMSESLMYPLNINIITK